MTLTTHIIIATAVAKPLGQFNPVFAFLAAVASHYLADALPHWDYTLISMADRDDAKKRRWLFSRTSLQRDFLFTAADGLLGVILVLVIFKPVPSHELILNLIAVAGGILPDFLEGVYYSKRAEFLKPFHNFHEKIHTKIKLGPYPLMGIPLQIFIILISAFFLFL